MFGVSADLTRLLGQRHAGFLWRSVALLIVAGEAGGHDVLPAGVTAARSWDHVVLSEVAGRLADAAVLAGEAIAQEDAFTRH